MTIVEFEKTARNESNGLSTEDRMHMLGYLEGLKLFSFPLHDTLIKRYFDKYPALNLFKEFNRGNI